MTSGVSPTGDDAAANLIGVASPMADTSGDEPLIERIAQMLVRIEVNYEREGSGPGSRFEGLRLETVQARAVVRHVRLADRGKSDG